jgi:hypothetical protein
VTPIAAVTRADIPMTNLRAREVKEWLFLAIAAPPDHELSNLSNIPLKNPQSKAKKCPKTAPQSRNRGIPLLFKMFVSGNKKPPKITRIWAVFY